MAKSKFAFLHSSRFHLLAAIAWLILFAPTVTAWKDSIPWLAFMSCYANFAGHWSAYQAARSEDHKTT